MNSISQLYEFLSGPLLFVTVSLCFAGLARKATNIISGLNNGLRFPVIQTENGLEDSGPIQPACTFAGRDIILAVATVIFHFAVIAAPLSARAHGILFDQGWNVFPPRFNPLFTTACTVTAIAAGIILLLRRTFVRRVFAVSSWRDYAAMICVLLPFATALMAKYMIGPYEIILLIHCAAGHALLLAIGWTRLGHMVFFTIWRLTAWNTQKDIT